MDTIINRLLDELKEQKISGSKVASILGLKKSPLTDWKNRHSRPTLEQIILLCENLALSADYLLLGIKNANEGNISPDEQELIDNFRLLQLKEKYKVLGRIETYLEEYEYNSECNSSDFDLLEVAEEWPTYGPKKSNIIIMDKHRLKYENKYETELWGQLSAGKGIEAIPIREIINAPIKCDFALRIQGNSMEPLYYDQQIIYLKQQPDVEQGQIAAVQVDDYIPIAYLKKVYKEGSNVRLVSLNPLYEDKIYPASYVKILGTVIEY